jgi:hypothetical protein
VTRSSGVLLASAAALFWLAWSFMPGVGVTDARRIFELVGSQRGDVLVSVIVQLVSAVLYVPALLGVAADARLGAWRAAGVLLVGAMGSAADAVLHLLAYAMTAPGVDPAPMIPVMQFMQGPGLALLGPLLLAFFAGGAWLSIAAARAGLVPRWNPWLHAIAIGVAIAGGASAKAGIGSPRIAGLAMLAIVSAAQIQVGLGLSRVGKLRT